MQRSFDIESFLTSALAEDIGAGDVTGNSVIPAETQAEFAFVAREPMVVAGLAYLPMLFGIIDQSITVTWHVKDGEGVEKGGFLATVKGPARALLAGERTALNLLQHLSGIATLTRSYVNAVRGTNAQILDTRKTMPGMRFLQKYAVKCGGGYNHRMGLYDAVMIKDNHIAVAGGVAQAIAAAKTSGLPVQVECDTLDQLDQALAAGVNSVLLDNMDLTTLAEGAKRARAKGVWSEASGNVNLETVTGIAQTGVDAISVGKLTHSVKAMDIGLDAA